MIFPKRKATRIIVTIVLFSFFLGVLPTGAAYYASATNSEGTVSTITLQSQAGSVIGLKQEYFCVNGNQELKGVIVSSLPVETAGTLYYGDRKLLLGESIPCDSIEKLRFVPSESVEAAVEIDFIPVFNDGAIGTGSNITIEYVVQENIAPTASDIEIQTYKNVPISVRLEASDPNGDLREYEITKEPKKGNLSLVDGNSFVYTPAENKSGKDTFTYVATDANGNISEQATVTVRIKKASTKITYSDMNDSTSYYSALRLAEANIFVGEKVGNIYLFNPDKVISRGEFLTMVLSMSGTDTDTDLESIAFDDDSTTPAWVKPYITTALKAGIITGVSTMGGQLVFRSEADLTQAEAAVIIDNALQIADSADTVTSNSTVPVWATQAVANLDSSGIIEANTLNMSDTVTRAQAADMISAALDVLEKKDDSLGLLSWASQ